MIKFFKKYKYTVGMLAIALIGGISYGYTYTKRESVQMELLKGGSLAKAVAILQRKGLFLEISPDINRCILPKIKKGVVVKMQLPKCDHYN